VKRSPILALLPLGGLLALLVFAAIVLLRGERAGGFDEAVMLGKPMTTMSLPRLDGAGETGHAAFAGRPYVLNVFASWCAPCRLEHPELMALEAAGVPILGVAFKDKPEASKAFLASLGDPFAAVGLDPEGRFGLEIGVAKVPQTYVIDAEGRIVAIRAGAIDRAFVEREILPLMGAPAGG